MANHYLLWASGADRPGIVASLTKILFSLGTNLEDSSMMRLGSEFAIFLIFTAETRSSAEKLEEALAPLGKSHALSYGVKRLTAAQAKFRPGARAAYIVTVHGHDRPGIVFHVTQALARRKFNITDLSTHRTGSGRSAGYILFIEGELSSERALPAVRADLSRLEEKLRTKIGIRAVDNAAL